MAIDFNKKTWVDRDSEYINGRTITDKDTGEVKHVLVGLDEGDVYTEGTPQDADTFNDLEDRIAQAFDEVPEQIDAYTKAETDTLLADKADIDDVPTNVSELTNDSDYQTGTQVSGAISSAVSALETEISGKADKATTYTKTQVDTALSNKADKATTYTKTEVDTALGDKADKSNTYTKSEVDTALADKAEYDDVYKIYPTATVSGAIASITDGADDVPTKQVVCSINPTETGTGTKSPQNPYVIGGHTGINVTRTGKNLFDIDNPLITAVSQTLLNNNPPIIENGKIYNGGRIGDTAGGGITIPATPNVNYTFSYYINGENCNGEVRAVTIDNNNIWTSNRVLASTAGGNAGTYKSVTVTMAEGYTHLFLALYSATKYGSWETDLQIEVGSTATTYEPYITPTTHTASFGQTVYGGEFVASEGEYDKVISDRAIFRVDNSLTIRIGAQNYIKSDACDFFVTVNSIYPRTTPSRQPVLTSDKLTFSKATIWSSPGHPNCFAINDNQIHCNIANDLLGITDYTQETITTAMAKIQAFLANNPINVVIPVAPTEIILPTKTEINTMLGANNIYHDCNGNTKVTYRALVSNTGGGSVVTVNPIVTTGTNIATITVDGTTKTIKSPVVINDNQAGANTTYSSNKIETLLILDGTSIGF